MSIALTEELIMQAKQEVLEKLPNYPYICLCTDEKYKYLFAVDNYYNGERIKLALTYLTASGRWDGLVDFSNEELGEQRENLCKLWLYPFIDYMVRTENKGADGGDMMRYANLFACVGNNLRSKGVDLFME